MSHICVTCVDEHNKPTPALRATAPLAGADDAVCSSLLEMASHAPPPTPLPTTQSDSGFASIQPVNTPSLSLLTCPCAQVVEFHLYQAPGMGISPTAPKDTAQLGLLILHLANLGYGITADEANIWGNRGCCTELSFLRVEAQRVRLSKQFLHQ